MASKQQQGYSMWVQYVPHSNREIGFYSRYFIVPKKNGGVASHFRSSRSERLRQAAQVKNVNFETNRATDQIRGLVCHDRSQGRKLPHIHPSVSQEVPEVHFWGQSKPIYTYVHITQSVPHSVKIDATFVPTNRHNLEQRAARTAYIFKNLQYDNKKCIRLLRPWRDAKHFSMSKTVFINTSAGVDLSVCSLWI